MQWTMKRILITGILCCIFSLPGLAGEYAVVSWKDISVQNDKKKKITEDELPVIIKNLLKSEEYKYWQFDEAYRIEGTGEYYRIELKKDDQKQTLNLDKYGNKVNIPD